MGAFDDLVPPSPVPAPAAATTTYRAPDGSQVSLPASASPDQVQAVMAGAHAQTGGGGSYTAVDPPAGGTFDDLVPATRPDDTLGFSQSFLTPGRNVLGWLSQVPVVGQGVDALSKLVKNGQGINSAISKFDNVIPQAAAQGRKPGIAGSLLGSVAGTLPTLPLGGGSAWAPVISGAVGGALQTDKPNDLAATAASGVAGALFGKAGDLAARGVLDTVAPVISPHVQALLDRGVPLTTGMIAGGKGLLGRAEQLGQSVPVTGELIRARGNDALRGFVKAVGNEVAPVLPHQPPPVIGGDTGHEIYQTVKAASDAAYRQAGNAPNIPLDQQFVNDMGLIRQSATVLPADEQRLFDHVVGKQVLDRISPIDTATASTLPTTPGMIPQQTGFTPDSLADAKAALNAERAGYKGSPGWDSVQLDHLTQTRDALTNLLARSSPQAAADLATADAAYPGVKTFERAVNNSTQNSTSPNGFFTPQQLQSAINRGATDSQRALASSPLQALAEAAKEVLPRKFKDVISPMQALIETGVGAGVVGSEVLHHAGPALMAAPLTLAPFYTRPVQNVLRAGMQATAAGRTAAEKVVGPLSGYASSLGTLGGTVAANPFLRLLDSQMAGTP